MAEEGEKVEKDRIPKIGELVKSATRTYALDAVVGEGGYGTVFESSDGQRRVAVKVEKFSKSMLHIEYSALKAATRRHSEHICELIDYGSEKPSYFFIVMTLLGKDLHKMRNEQPERRFTLSTAIRVGMQTLQAIKEIHQCGFISRDVKPGNFAVGLKETDDHRTIFMFDFGLAKKYIDKNGNPYPSRGEIGWRGTTRYGSLNAHYRLDLGRRDDIESWLYLLVEITRGSLPWRHVPERIGVQAGKELARQAGRVQFFHKCPKKYDKLLTMVDALTFGDEPKYDEFYDVLDEIRKDRKFRLHSRFDWDRDASTTMSTTASVSSPTDEPQRAAIDALKRTEIEDGVFKEMFSQHSSHQ